MNIYIYGSKGFKEEIHKTLEHANIKFKIDVDAKIEDINSLDELKEKIIQFPSDIYLIDEEKIIKKNLLNKKIKLFTPKDAIEHEFLLENGVADVSVESLDEIPRYIVQKYDEKSSKETNIQESIIEIVDDAYNESENTIDLDDELSALLEPESKSSEFKEDVGLNNINSDYDDELTHEDSQIEELVEDEELSIESNDEEKNELDLDSLTQELKELDELDLDNNEDIPNVEDELDSLLELDEEVSDSVNDNEDLITSLNEIDEDDVLSQALEIEGDDEFDDIFKELDGLELESIDESSNVDEDLDNLLDLEDISSPSEDEENNFDLDEIDELKDMKSFEQSDNDMDDLLSDLEDLNEDNDTVINDNNFLEEINKGEEMEQDEFSQLDSLNESDILSALEDIDSIPVSSSPKIEASNTNASANEASQKVEVSGVNANDLGALINQLLNNKTLEITIKIKD